MTDTTSHLLLPVSHYGWAKKLANPSRPTDWRKVFIEHPEFFRVSEPDKKTKKEWVSLRWRHGYDRTNDVEQRKELTVTELEQVAEGEWNSRLTRKPLTSGEIETLINAAIEMHGRAIAFAEEKRWLINILFTVAGIVIGAVLDRLLK